MEDQDLNAIEGTDVVIEFRPLDDAAAALVKEHFADQEVLESHAFSGAEVLTLIVQATTGTLGSVLTFLGQYRQRFSGTSIRIGKREVEIKGYSPDELRTLLESGSVETIIRAMGRG